MTTQETIPLVKIKAFRPCAEQWAKVKALYPKGIPFTEEACLALHDAGLDVLWGMTRLMTTDQQRRFILATLRYRQPHMVSLFEKAGLPKWAEKLKALKFDAFADAKEAEPIMAAVRVAVWDAARAAGDAWRELISIAYGIMAAVPS